MILKRGVLLADALEELDELAFVIWLATGLRGVGLVAYCSSYLVCLPVHERGVLAPELASEAQIS